MTMRKICVVTGTRAEYGILYWLMREIKEDPELQLQIIVTGSHLSPEFGLTYRTIERDGFVIDEKIEMLLSSDTVVGVTKSLGLATIGFADVYQRLKPDIVVILGDRYEMLAAAQAAMIACIPIAHLSGGEVTEGVIDDAIRHSITKMASLHYVATEAYRKRVIQLGEHPDRVKNFGDPGLDNIRKLKLLTRRELECELGFCLSDPVFLVTYHPVTLQAGKNNREVWELLSALDCFPEATIIITKSNADAGAREIWDILNNYALARKERVFLVSSLGQLKYLSLMALSMVVIGNSSSGIVEAPALKVPTVNIGNRQTGRLKAASVIDCEPRSEEIVNAIKHALSQEFRATLHDVKSLYGDCDASRKIKEDLKCVDLSRLLQKGFYDVPF